MPLNINSTRRQRRRGYTAVVGLKTFGVLFILSFITSLPAYGQTSSYSDSWFASASPGSDKGCGITQHNYSSYSHNAGVSVTITSPTGRTASYGGSGSSYARADVALPYIAGERGNFTVRSNHYGNCPYYGGGGSYAATTTSSFVFDYSRNVMKRRDGSTYFYVLKENCYAFCALKDGYGSSDYLGEYCLIEVPYVRSKDNCLFEKHLYTITRNVPSNTDCDTILAELQAGDQQQNSE